MVKIKKYWKKNIRNIIKYKFSTSKREDVLTSLKSFYRYDNGSNQYPHYVEDDRFNHIIDYGATAFASSDIKKIDGHQELNLRYHSDKNTAQLYTKFNLLNNCNTHNIVELQMPISYIDLQVGDIIYLPLIDNKKIFNIDYSIVDFKNSQPVYPAWIIMETNISQSSINIKAIQLHYLGSDGMHGFDFPPDFKDVEYQVFGNMNEFSSNINFISSEPVPNINYNPAATIHNGIEIPYFNISYFLGLSNDSNFDVSMVDLENLEHVVATRPEIFQPNSIYREIFKYDSAGGERIWSNNVDADSPALAQLISDLLAVIDFNS